MLLSALGDVFTLPMPVWEKLLRTVILYVFLVGALRLAGKRELGQTNTLDLVVLLLVANAVQNGIIGNDVSVTGALIGAATLFVVNSLFSRAVFRSTRVRDLLEGEPAMLIEEGHPVTRELRRQMISLPELRAIARRQGFPELGEVYTAWLETNGTVSMFRKGEPGHYHPDQPGLRAGKRRTRRSR
jgi:uncharacterized membrane protein YcaP (DUF421 family)